MSTTRQEQALENGRKLNAIVAEIKKKRPAWKKKEQS
jgi:hypothetical protein